MKFSNLSRRDVLIGSLVCGALPLLTSSNISLANEALGANPKTSANGWPIQNPSAPGSQIQKCDISGLATKYEVSAGDVNNILSDFVRQMHYRVKDIGPMEVTGWKPLSDDWEGTPYSNLSSGTALQIRSSMPVDSYFPYEIDLTHKLLSEYSGIIAWEADSSIKDESLFYINSDPSDSSFIKIAEDIKLRSRADIRIS